MDLTESGAVEGSTFRLGRPGELNSFDRSPSYYGDQQDTVFLVPQGPRVAPAVESVSERRRSAEHVAMQVRPQRVAPRGVSMRTGSRR